MTIPEYPEQGYLQYPHYYYPHYLHYPPYTEGQEQLEGEPEGGDTAVPYAHVRYANSDTVYTV